MVKKQEIQDISSDSEQYEVEAIRRARATIKKKWEYLIKWKGYSESDNSWEPEAHLSGCRELLNNFWSRAGATRKSQVTSLPYGYEVVPRDRMESENQKNDRQTHSKRSASTNVTTDSEEDVMELIINEDPKPNAPEKRNIISPVEMSSSNAISDDHSPPGVVNENNSSDLDDIPLSQFQTLHAPQAMKRQRSDEDVEKMGSAKRHSPSQSGSLGHNQNPNVYPTEVDLELFGAVSGAEADTHPAPDASKLPGLAPNISTNLPVHKLRKLQPKVKPIDVVDKFHAIPTKSRIVKMGSGTGSIAGVTNLPSPISPSVSTKAYADQWLNDNFQPSVVATPAIQNPTPVLPNFGKRWKWSGQLCVGDNESDDGFADLIGNVKMIDSVSGETRPNDLSMHILLPSGVDSLCFRYTYSLSTITTALSNFRIAHFTRMMGDLPVTTPSIDEENLFASLVTFMEKADMYSCMPLTLHNTRVATMFIIPASKQQIWDTVKLPEKLRQVDTTPSLLVAVGIQVYEASKGKFANQDNPWETRDHGFSPSYLLSFPDFGRAALRLEFPEQSFRRLSHRKYSYFSGSLSAAAAQAQGLLDPEGEPYTKALKIVMEAIPGTERLPLHDGEARVIFIHVGAWKMLHKLPGLVDRRLRRLDVQFFTYGADPTIERRFWGIQEVFRIGGLVTITPGALLENPEGILKLVGEMHDHVLWSCYIHPAVISILVKLLKGTGVPEINIDRISAVLRPLTGILRAIEKEQLEVMWHPPAPYQWRTLSSNSSPHSLKDCEPKRMTWFLKQRAISRLYGTDFTEECERWFPAANRTEKDIENLLVDDLVVMQSEFRKDYRRFVIITDTRSTSNASKEAATASTSNYTARDMFEFTNIKQFKFEEELNVS